MKKKICKKYGWILIWGLVSIVFAAVLQFLFSLEAPIPFLQAKWSAGDILTYSSTILLGLLALWQNQRFKNENDATQEKLEALSTRANELQITSKLIEHEAERINLLRTQFQTFFDACACNYLVADYKDTAKGEKRYAYYSTLRSSQIRTSYQVLWQQLNMDKGYNSLVDDVIKNAQRLSASAMGLMLSFTLAQDGDTSENDTKETARQIFISLDDGEIDNLKKISDEVLGSQNYVGTVIWERAFAPKNDAKYFSTSHDFVLVYAKNIEDFEIGKLPRTQEANARYKNPDNDPRGPWAADNMTVKTYSAAYGCNLLTMFEVFSK